MLHRLRNIRWMPLIILVLIFFMLTGIALGMTATNTVPNTYASQTQHLVEAEHLQPDECRQENMNLQDYIIITTPNTTTVGTAANELFFGTAGRDIIRGGGGRDCIVGRGGDDRYCPYTGLGALLCLFFPEGTLEGLEGGDGDDVIIGGGGNDACFGEGGTDIFYGCETEVQ